MKRATAIAITITIVLASTAARAQSAADIATARDLFREGMELRTQGHLAEALAKLKAAHDLYETPPSALELARAQIDAGLLAEALETLLSIERIPSAKESEHAKQARVDAATLVTNVRSRIPSLRVDVAGATDGAVVTLDGAVVPSSLFGVARKVDPGHHVIRSRNAAGNERKVEIDVPEGQTAIASIEIDAADMQILGAFGGVVTSNTSSSTATRSDRFSVLYKFLPAATNERWVLRGRDGKAQCRLPCEQWIGENSGMYLERAPIADDAEKRLVEVPATLPATIGSSVTARPHAGMGTSGMAAFGSTLAVVGVLGLIGGPSTLIAGLADLSSTNNSARDVAIVGGVITGVSLACLVIGIVLTKHNYASRMDYVVSP